MTDVKGLVSGIKRMEIHDGEGLRTTVFFKGCPLSCMWCHNPESIGYGRQLAYFSVKCMGCGECLPVCEAGALTRIGEIDRERCTVCGGCAEVCPTEALVVYGREYTPEALVSEVMADGPFFENGGGVTLSGGECLTQPHFVTETARLLKARGVSVFVDTCGYVSREVIDGILPYTDKFLYDIKAASGATHEKCTGRDNALIIENLKYLSDRGARVEIRIPFVPELNGAEIEAIAELLCEVRIEKVKVLPYHNFAASRYGALGMPCNMPRAIPSAEEAEAVRRALRQRLKGVPVE